MSCSRENALDCARRVRLFLLDVDGVMTDGGIIHGSSGLELKRFHCQDGLGLRLLAENGIATGIITARASDAVRARAAELGMHHLHENAQDKLAVFEGILKEEGLTPGECAYMGDDWIDLPLLNRVGLALAPADAVPEVRARVHHVTEGRGGRGAVREACNLILEAQGLMAGILARYNR